jgi:tetratricopeptide (TPR) repeat protein
VETHPESAEAWALLAAALAPSKDHREEARASFERALRHDAAHEEALIGLGALSLAEGAFEEAMALYARALEADPGERRAARGLVDALVELGRSDEARAFLERHLATGDAYDGDAALRLAGLLASRDPERSLAMARRALRFGAGIEAVQQIERLQGKPMAGARP